MQEQELQQVYEMVDSIPFSRAKKNIHRDFSDGVMMAELIYHYNPKLVYLHNYPPANSLAKKIQNWTTLATKVLKKLGIHLTKIHIENIVNAVPGVVEEVLYEILLKFQRPQDEGSLSMNAKKGTNSRTRAKRHLEQDERSNHEYEQDKEQESSQQNNDVQAEEILLLVQRIDSASFELQRLQNLSKEKDEVIKNLEKKLEKILFG